MRELYNVFSDWKMLAPALFILVNSATPGMGSASFYFYTNELKIDKEWMAILSTVDSIAGLGGMALYYTFFTKYGPKSILFYGTILVTLICSSQLLLYSHANRAIGIPDVTFLFMDDVILITMGQVLFVPMFTLIAMLCPKGLEGTVFCVYTALMNGGAQLSVLFSAMLMDVFGITAQNFDNIVSMRIVTLFMQLIPCLLIFLIPSDDEMKAMLEERKQADALAMLATREANSGQGVEAEGPFDSPVDS